MKEEFIKIFKEDFIKIFKDNITRPGADALLAWLEKSSFFEDPASTKFHLAEPGGLCEHSLNVYRRLKRFVEAESEYDISFASISDETIAICGLLHDVCKVGCYVKEPKNQKTYDPEKVSNAQRWQVKHDDLGDFIWETVIGYKYDDTMPYGHGEKSVYIISGFMKLSREEAFAIRYHMGPFIEGEMQNASKAFELYPLALFTHLADLTASKLDEKEAVGS